MPPSRVVDLGETLIARILSALLAATLVLPVAAADIALPDLFDPDEPATAFAAAACGVGEASAHAEATGDGYVSASTSASVPPLTLYEDDYAYSGNGKATSHSAATGAGLGRASASAYGSGSDESWASAQHDCDLADVITPHILLGCLATRGASATFEGAVAESPQGGLWLVGTFEDATGTHQFAGPLDRPLVLLPRLVSVYVPDDLVATPLRVDAQFDTTPNGSSCVSRLYAA